MALPRMVRRLLRKNRIARLARSARTRDELYRLTEDFCAAANLSARTKRAGRLFSYIWSEGSDRARSVRLPRWVAMLESDPNRSAAFQGAWSLLLSELDSVPLLANAGLPSNPGLFSELFRRFFVRLLPTARRDEDAGLLFSSIFSSPEAVERFAAMDGQIYERLAKLLWPEDGFDAAGRVRQDLRQALQLLATRVAGRGVSSAIRDRGAAEDVEHSPFYQLIFATEVFVNRTGDESCTTFLREAPPWRETIDRCRQELDFVHLEMEHAGVSTALVYDLRTIEGSLDRMQLLAAVYDSGETVGETSSSAASVRTLEIQSADKRPPARQLLDTLARGRLDDTRLSHLVSQNLNLIARKTVERTGHSGEHYVATNHHQYWGMWRAAAGGGLLTVFTAAIKLRIAGAHFPLFVEGFLIGTDYAISFILLQVFHLALATKQPSMTAAALAGIVRENRGVSRWSKISDYAAQITRTQLAAAFGNVIAVCLGGIVFEYAWSHLFTTHFLSPDKVEHTYHGLNPLESGTAIFAALTGVILWVGGLAGGWCENFVVYHRISDAIVQHPLGSRIGQRKMRRAADWLENNVAAWSNSIVLGYLLGLTPVIARFFGIPLDVRHVTLNTGMLALAAAQFGIGAFEKTWLYYAAAGIGVTFVLNLSVSFAIASIVALRAYNVPPSEQMEIVKFVFKEFFRSPREFLFPRRSDSLEPIVEASGQIASEIASEAALLAGAEPKHPSESVGPVEV